MRCRLCQSKDGLLAGCSVDDRAYFACKNCYLISADKKHFLGRDKEKERYLTHQNGIQYEGYVKFLHRAIDPALEFLKKEMLGLDYGCGHVPTLSKLLAMKGFKCEDYDPFFVGHKLDKTFDFIFTTEVFEHFFYPDSEIKKIKALLKEKGLLVVMTERWRNLDQFSQWSYTRDLSHVSFFHSKTFGYICNNFGFSRIFDDDNRVIILRNN
ncbi:MAG: class I SAM-dependent methyltransferase [Nitrospirae bacterium]|nr:class I SAM-dependent methyltransferase [Nitrospirota bacterium]